MSEKTTKAYKVDTDIRQKVEELFSQSGMETEGAFLDHMATIYEMHLLKNGSGYAKQIAALGYHTKAIIEGTLAMIQTEAGERLRIAEEYEEKLADLTATIFDQEKDIRDLKLQVDAHTDTIKNTMQKLQDATDLVKQHEQTNSRGEELLAALRRDNERLTRELTDNLQQIEDVGKLRQRVSELERFQIQHEDKIARMEQDAREVTKSRESDIKHFEETLAKTESVWNGRLASVEQKHKDELSIAKERAEIAQEKAVAAAERKHGAEIRKLYDEMEKIRQQLGAAQAEVVKANLEARAKRPQN